MRNYVRQGVCVCGGGGDSEAISDSVRQLLGVCVALCMCVCVWGGGGSEANSKRMESV